MNREELKLKVLRGKVRLRHPGNPATEYPAGTTVTLFDNANANRNKKPACAWIKAITIPAAGQNPEQPAAFVILSRHDTVPGCGAVRNIIFQFDAKPLPSKPGAPGTGGHPILKHKAHRIRDGRKDRTGANGNLPKPNRFSIRTNRDAAKRIKGIIITRGPRRIAITPP